MMHISLRSILLSVIFMLSFFHALSQQKNKYDPWIPYRDGNLWGLCDTLGNIKITPFADTITTFKINHEDLYSRYIFCMGNIEKVLDNTGEILIENRDYDSVSIDWINRGVLVFKNDKLGVFSGGKELIPCIYDHISSFRNDCLKVETANKTGVLNPSGKSVIPCIYDYISEQQNNFFRVQKGKKWGVIDSAGKEIIPCKYNRIEEEINGCFSVFKGDKVGVVNSLGKLIIPIEFYHIRYDDKSNDTIIWNAEKKTGAIKQYTDVRIKGLVDPRYSTANFGSYSQPRYNFSEEIWNNISEITKEYGEILNSKYIDNRFAIVMRRNDSATTYEDQYQFGVVNILNKKVIFKQVYRGLSHVATENGKTIFKLTKHGKSNFVTEDLKRIPPYDFNYSSAYDRDIYLIKKEDKWGAKVFNTIYPFIPIKYKDIKLHQEIWVNEKWSFILFEASLENGKKGFVGENAIEYFKN